MSQFAGYDSFDAAVEANSEKEDHKAYAAALHREATGEWPGEKAADCFDGREAHLNALLTAAAKMDVEPDEAFIGEVREKAGYRSNSELVSAKARPSEDPEKSETIKNERSYLNVFFERAEGELLEREEYEHVIFSHCGLYRPLNADIWEAVSLPIGFAQSSSDTYLYDQNFVRIVLPIELEDGGASDAVQEAIEGAEGQYGDAVPPVVNVLQELDVLDEETQPASVDELYFELSEHKVPVQEVVDHYAAEREEMEDEKPAEVEDTKAEPSGVIDRLLSLGR